MHAPSLPRSGLWSHLVTFPLVCVFCLPGGAVLIEITRGAVGEPIPRPLEAAVVCASAIFLALCLFMTWTLARAFGWMLAFLGHAALANALVPGRAADSQLIWLGAGAVLGAVVGLLGSPARNRARSPGEATEAIDGTGPEPGPADNHARLAWLLPPRYAVMAGVLAVGGLGVLAVRYEIRVDRQARIAQAVARSHGHTIYDHPGTPPLLFKWLDVIPRGDEHYCLRSVELGASAGNEELVELAEMGLGSLPHLRELRMRHSRVTDDGLTTVVPLLVLERITMGRATTDSGLVCLDSVPTLRVLDLTGTRVTGEGLRLAGCLSALACLNLQNTRITNDDLAQLKAFQQLISLDLSATEVTDAGLVHLSQLPNLSSLMLMNTRITDAGLKHLVPIPSLRWLFVTGSQVSRAGLAEFHRARPRVWTD